jgi:hypothetical protein
MTTTNLRRAALALATLGGLASPVALGQVAAPPPVSAAQCTQTSERLYAEAEQQEKRTRRPIPRDFARVAANLDEFCEQGDFARARVAIGWMRRCLADFMRDSGSCTRNRAYFCATFPDSDGCKRP